MFQHSPVNDDSVLLINGQHLNLSERRYLFHFLVFLQISTCLVIVAVGDGFLRILNENFVAMVADEFEFVYAVELFVVVVTKLGQLNDDSWVIGMVKLSDWRYVHSLVYKQQLLSERLVDI